VGAAVGITFNNAGYLAETFRGALKAIPATQTRAARSLGMSPLRRPSGDRHAADVPDFLPADDQPDGLGGPDDLAGASSVGLNE
jgi:hypothetical protein